MNKTLVLDVGGVLATNLTPKLWTELAKLGAVEEALLYSTYKEQLSAKLWCGQITENDWWEWLEQHHVVIAPAKRAAFMQQFLQPLPAINKLEQWANHCQIIIMSNHRTEWLAPFLQPYEQHFHQIYVSDQAQLCKPDANWFNQINDTIGDGQSVHFVDDSTKNIEVGRQIGWLVTLADEAGHWTKAIDQWLQLT